jgi:hypothetical protein
VGSEQATPRRSTRASARARRHVGSLAVALLCLASGCGRSTPNSTAEGAAREFVEQAASYAGNPTQAQAIFRLLSARGRANLQLRADRYAAATGRPIDPAAMLVPSRLTLRFTPRSYESTESADRATVEVRGAGPSEVAHIPCVLEEGLWQIDIILPELPPTRKRSSDEP